MKKTPLILIFFLMLYIAPLIFAPSSYSSTIPAEQNMSKEFSQSAYLDESPYSILDFSETLDDDVFYTSDGFYDETPVYAFDGYDDWADTLHFNDTQYWSSFNNLWEYVEFQGQYAIEGFDYFVYGKSVIEIGNLSVYDTMIQDFQFLFNFTTSYAWHNGTYWGTNYEPEIVNLIACIGDGEDPPTSYISIDYIELRFHYLPILDYSYATGYTNWGESFTNVSDWTENSFEATDATSSDGDLLEMEVASAAGNDQDRFYTNTPSISAGTYYMEVRWKVNSTANIDYVYFVVFPLNTMAGGGVVPCYKAPPTTTDWITQKGLVSIDIESIEIRVMHDAGSKVNIQVDYLRISPADEMGFQHDGGTTEGISSADGGSIATDSDKTNLTADADGSTFLIVADTTTTATAISCTYYPFLSLSLTSGSGNWTLEQYDGSAYATLQSSTTISSGLKRFNMRTFDTYVSWWRITLTAGSILIFDWTKAYSIANFTVTQSTVLVSEYAYVTGGELHFNLDGNSDYILLNYDPTISVDSTTYNYWELAIDNVGSGTSHTDDYGIDFYVGAWQGYTYDTTNDTMPTGTTTDFRIISYDTYSLQSLIFTDLHHWRVVDTEIIYFVLPEWHVADSASIIFVLAFSSSNVDFWLVFLGMFLVPASALYFVKGGKNEMSMDKVFYCIVAFMLGWALIFIGAS